MKHGVAILLLFLGACSTQASNDQPVPPNANPLGNGNRLREVQDPASPDYAPNQNVNVTSVVVTAVDTFDETHNGKSRGTIFVEDADQASPYGGISMYSPTFVPANLRLAPGDVVDIYGQYVEQQTIGSTVNFSPEFLPQMNKPQVQLRFETQAPQPIEVKLADLENWSTARQYIGLLITLKNVTVALAPTTDSSGRVQAALDSTAGAPAINNELFDLQTSAVPAGQTFSSVTGICDFFFNILIAPRSADDLVK